MSSFGNPYTDEVLAAIDGSNWSLAWNTVRTGRITFHISNVLQIAGRRIFGASGEMADAVAGKIGCLLPTQKMLDLAAVSATKAGGPFTQPNGAVGMTRTAADNHAAKHFGRYNPDFQQLAGEGKSYVLTNRLWDDPSRAAIYGVGPWSLQPLYVKHFWREFWDYSQGLGPFVHPMVTIDGQDKDLREVLLSSDASLFSYEGKMRGWHHPRAKEFQTLMEPLPILVPDKPEVKYRQAKNYGPKPIEPKLIVLHTAEMPEKSVAADNLQAWICGPNAPQVSFHFSVDNDSVHQMLKLNERAWAAGKTGNNLGIHIELPGYARQSEAEWADDFSTRQLALCARVVKTLSLKLGIPLALVEPGGLRAGESGVTDHRRIRDAWRETTHGDVGEHFPWDTFLRRCREAIPLDLH